MRVLILSWRCIKNPEMGGSEIYFHEIAKRWVKEGHKIIWFSPNFLGGKKEEICEGIKIVRRGNRATVYVHAFLNYIQNKLGKFDIIIDVENGIPFFSPLYIKNGKVFLHIHHLHKDIWFKQMPLHTATLGYLLETIFMPRIYKNNEVITISKSSANEINSKKVTRNRISIVNPGVKFYNYKKFQKNKTPSFLFLNRIKKYKGIDVFLNTAKILKNEKIEFWVAGSGNYLNDSKKFVIKNKLENVKFFGRISEEKKKELMQRTWAFINPSYKEGWGIVNIESNYFGTIVLGSDVPGIKDSVINEKTGLLFKYGDSNELAKKILWTIKNKKNRIKMEAFAVNFSKAFSWDIKSREYLKIITNQNLSHKLLQQDFP